MGLGVKLAESLPSQKPVEVEGGENAEIEDMPDEELLMDELALRF